jgi:DNA-binding transcriptional LysR family regulator
MVRLRRSKNPAVSKPLPDSGEGVGVARLADVIVGEAIRRGQLVQLLADAHKRELVPLSAVYVPGRHRLPKVSVFLDFLAERFGSAPWRQ